MDRSSTSELRSGSRLAERYELLEQIGYGGMGRVYRARDELLGREVAVKLIEASAAEDGDLGRSCVEEARAAAHLAHPGIATVFDAGTQDAHSYIVMELVEGPTLRQMQSERRRPAPQEAARLVARVADALEAAHRQGVVHCDVKPHNIILTPSGEPKLVDFGIARATTRTRTQASEITGSAAYLSPEQVCGERIDGQTDVYALGVVLYELLTGRPPFQSQNLAATVSQRLVIDPPPPRSLNPSIPPALEQVALTALARERSRRYSSAGAFRDGLQAAAGGRPAGRGRRTARPTARAATGRATGAPLSVALQRRIGASIGPGVAALGLLGVVTALAVVVLASALLGSAAGAEAGSEQTTAPDLAGVAISEVPDLLTESGVAVGAIRTRAVEPARVGTVLEQQPPAGAEMQAGDALQLVVGVPREE